MSKLEERLLEIIGDEDKVKTVTSSIGEFMIPKSEYAKLRDTLNSRDEAYKAKETELEEFRVSSMSEKDKIQHELSKAQALQRELGIKTNRVDAKEILVKAGLSEEDYTKILDSSVSEDRDKTLGIVNGFVELLGKQKDVVTNQVKENLLNKTKQPTTGDPTNTKEPKAIKTTF